MLGELERPAVTERQLVRQSTGVQEATRWTDRRAGASSTCRSASLQVALERPVDTECQFFSQRTGVQTSRKTARSAGASSACRAVDLADPRRIATTDPYIELTSRTAVVVVDDTDEEIDGLDEASAPICEESARRTGPPACSGRSLLGQTSALDEGLLLGASGSLLGN